MLEIIIIVVGIGLDRITKIIALNGLQSLPGGDYALWPGVFHFTYIENRGAAFGILQNSQIIFIIIGSAVAGVIGYLLINKRNDFPLWVRCTMAVVLAGAIGNLIDRVFFGYVVDFLYFKLINFAIFNVADCFVVVGTIIIAVYLLFVYKEPAKAENI